MNFRQLRCDPLTVGRPRAQCLERNCRGQEGYALREDPGERLSFHRTDAVPGVEVMASFNSTQPWHVFHERVAVCACSEADAGIAYRGRRLRATDGSVSYFEPGEVHRNTDVGKAAAFKVIFIELGA